MLRMIWDSSLSDTKTEERHQQLPQKSETGDTQESSGVGFQILLSLALLTTMPDFTCYTGYLGGIWINEFTDAGFVSSDLGAFISISLLSRKFFVLAHHLFSLQFSIHTKYWRRNRRIIGVCSGERR